VLAGFALLVIMLANIKLSDLISSEYDSYENHLHWIPLTLQFHNNDNDNTQSLNKESLSKYY
jgi:hypothetical protein